jgi:hypothetical protein
MIWGTTWDQKTARETGGFRWFAWRPVFLEDGRMAWLETVHCWRDRWDGETTLAGRPWYYRAVR